jgi:hypothetical protein
MPVPSGSQPLQLPEIQWPERPWWMIVPGQGGWNRLLRRDVTAFSQVLPRPPTQEETEALAEYMAVKERYSAAAWHLGPVMFISTMYAFRRTGFGARSMAYWSSRSWVNQEWLNRMSPNTRIFTIAAGLSIATQTALVMVLGPFGQLHAGLRGSKDPRLEQLSRDLRDRLQNMQQQRQQNSGPGMQRRPGGTQPDGAQHPSSGASSYREPEPALLDQITRERRGLEEKLRGLKTAIDRIDKSLSEASGVDVQAVLSQAKNESVRYANEALQRYSAVVEDERQIRQKLDLPPVEPIEFGLEGLQPDGYSQGQASPEQNFQQGSQQDSAKGSEPEQSWGMSARGQRPAPPAPPSSGENDWDPLDELDDASPVAASERGRPSPSPVAAGGSAWARLRQKAGAGATSGNQSSNAAPGQEWPPRQPSQAYPARNQAENDSAYNQGARERTLSKDEAQKEFDEMLERERSGKSDDAQREERKRRW